MLNNYTEEELMRTLDNVMEAWAKRLLKHEGYDLNNDDTVTIERRQVKDLHDRSRVAYEVLDIYVNDDLEMIYNESVYDILEDVVEIAQEVDIQERNRSLMNSSFGRPSHSRH